MTKPIVLEGEFIHSKLSEGVSIIVPTYRERENVLALLARINDLREENAMTLEVLFMDDDSRDGSAELVADSGYPWARMITRTENRGLSAAVIDGFLAAQYPLLVCMDCDLSHPPEKIPQMLLGLNTGQELVIGSRYVPGGTTDDDWGVLRWLNSIVATVLARPLTSVRDPMSGFFTMRKADFDQAEAPNPVGYKIMLEMIVKCGFENVGEVPIHFTDRVHGESKLSFKEQLKYIQHLRRLYLFKFANAMHLLQFLVVGAIGTLINLVVISLLQAFGLPDMACLIGGIGVSVFTNFLLNRRFTFSYAKDGNFARQLVAFIGASAVGLAVNLTVALVMRNSVVEDGPYALQLAALTGIACGMAFNFLSTRYLVFRKRYYLKK